MQSLPAVVQRFQTTAIADASGRARLATVALHLGDATCARQMLAVTKDPTRRTAFIVGFPRWHENVSSLATFLEDADGSFRSGLLAALALFPSGDLNPDGREALTTAVAKLYTDAPDAAAHNAAYCVLTNWKLPVPALKGTPGLPPERDWFINGQGVPMIRIPAGTRPKGVRAEPSPLGTGAEGGARTWTGKTWVGGATAVGSGAKPRRGWGSLM